MSELFILFLQALKYFQIFYQTLLKYNLVVITLCAFVLFACIKFDTIWYTFYPPSDLITGKILLDRLISLKGEVHWTCRENAEQTAKINAVSSAIYGIINTHSNDTMYSILENEMFRLDYELNYSSRLSSKVGCANEIS